MTNHSTTTEAALEPCPFCGVVPTMQHHTQEEEMDDGRYLFFVECANGKCPMALVSTGGPLKSAKDAADKWNSRIPAPSVAPTDALKDLFALFTRDSSGHWNFNSLSRDASKLDEIMERLTNAPSVAPEVNEALDNAVRRVAEKCFAIMERYCVCMSSDSGAEASPLSVEDLDEIRKRRAGILFPDGRPTGAWLDIDRLLAHAEALRRAVNVRTVAISNQLAMINGLAPVEQSDADHIADGAIGWNGGPV